MGHKFWTLGLLCGLAALAACANPPASRRGESEARGRPRMPPARVDPLAAAPHSAARPRMLLARIDQLEADLHSEATAIDTLAVLQERHGEAVQVACRVTDEHVNEMHRLLVAQTEKRKEKALKSHRRVVALGRASHGPLSMR